MAIDHSRSSWSTADSTLVLKVFCSVNGVVAVISRAEVFKINEFPGESWHLNRNEVATPNRCKVGIVAKRQISGCRRPIKYQLFDLLTLL